MIGMQSASNFTSFEEMWIAAITHIERIWEKTVAEYRERDGFSSWNSRYVGLRRTDELLQYVNQARNAEEHTTQSSVTLRPGSLGIRGVNGRLFIKNLTIRAGVIERLEVGDDTPAEIVIDRPKAILSEFINRGTKFNPPNHHLGKALQKIDPHSIAGHALEFYIEYLKQLEEKYHGA